jgi:nitroreductase
MDFYDVVRQRRSVRKYKAEPVDRAVIERILEAGRQAPSWKNRQCWRYILISDPELKRTLGELVDNPGAECYVNAPYVLALCADSTDSGTMSGKEYYLVDCGISMEHIVLAAQAEGLGTCWVGYFAENPVKGLLKVPQDTHVVAITPIGYPDEAPAARPRKTMQEIVFENTWRAE